MMYRQCKITESTYGGYEWVHKPTFDASWEGYWNTRGAGFGLTIEDCIIEIDEYLEKIGYEDQTIN